MRIAPLAVLAALLASGCGNAPTPPPDIGLIPSPSAFRDVRYPAEGLRLRAPANWRIFPGQAPQVATIAIGDAQIALWRYPRTEPLPATRSQLHAARHALVAQVQRRDPSFELTSSRLVLKPNLRAVELVGQGTTQGEPRAVRSLHAYADGHEVVVDAFAPPKDFPRVDEQTFARVTRSLRLGTPRS